MSDTTPQGEQARTANLCCGHRTCQREVEQLLAAAWNNGCGTGFVQANRGAFLIDVEARNPYRAPRNRSGKPEDQR